jgi:tetratricopeptide (TPR) repeat protein
MKNKLLLMFLFLCYAVIGFSEVSAQGYGDRNRPAGRGTYRITGKVYLPDGKPAGDVNVSANSLELSGGGTTRTDQDGTFTISGLSSGNYSVSVRQEGYPAENESVTIAEGTISGQAFQLAFYLRAPGQPKGTRPANPLLKDVPKEPTAKFNKAMEKMGSGDSKAAIALFDEAIALHPNFAAAYYERGAALLKLNELDKALESFVKAIELKPDYVEPKYSVGYTQYLKKNYEVAAAVFDDVLKQKKDMADASMYLGISLFYLKNVDAAEATLQKAIGMPGGERLALAHLYLGQIYIQKKKNNEAAAELEKYLDLVPKAPNADKLRSTIADLKKKT